jgi:hypothetical protein
MRPYGLEGGRYDVKQESCHFTESGGCPKAHLRRSRTDSGQQNQPSRSGGRDFREL